MKVVNRPVEMIATFTKNGTVRPARFRLQTEEQSEIVVKVDRIIAQNLEKLAGNKMLVYRCQSIINGSERIYELKYELDTCKWVLFKI